MYTVPKLTDHSPSALDAASRDLLSALESEATAVNGENEYKLFRDRWLARKDGIATQINEGWLKAAPKEGKRDIGQRVNELKKTIETVVEETLQRAKGGASASRLASECVDITLPGVRRPIGAEHPVIRTMNDSGTSSNVLVTSSSGVDRIASRLATASLVSIIAKVSTVSFAFSA